MKHLKKMVSLIIALVMIVGTMNVAFAADGDLTPDATITITGLDAGDTVHLYQILQWDTNDGWVLVHAAGQPSPLADLIDSTKTDYYSAGVKNLVDNVPNTSLTKDDLDKIAKIVKDKNATDLAGTTVDSETFTYSTTSAPGMYVALVTPGEAGVIYNPIVVSSDFSTTPNTSEIDASKANMGTSSVAKKEKITVDKTGEEEDQADNQTTNDKTDGTNNAHDVGDIVKFTITTQIPAYSDAYTNPSFSVSDTLSNGLVIVEDAEHESTIESGTVKVDTTADGYQAIANNGTSFKITFDSADIAALETYQEVTITYWAKITGDCATNVTEEENTVTVEFSNNPNSDTDKGTIKDKTKHYTFTIDGNLLGETSYKNSELVKVGVDEEGNPIESVINESNGSSQAALEGAIFKLYQTPEAAEAENDDLLYKNNVFTGTVTSDAQGLLKIEGLDVGDYYLKEITAPKGYIRSTKVWHINVSAVIEDEETTETDAAGREIKYTVPVLKSYTITIDDGETTTGASTFTATITGSEVLTSTSKGDVSSSIPNTKGVELPSTGGMGTTIFYIIGAALVLGAGVLLVTRRRMNVQ